MKLNVEFQEPDRKKKIKRIIAREGLIFLATVGIGFLLWYTSIQLDPATFIYLNGCGQLLMFVIYPGYLAIRFIIWAVRALRER